MYRLRRRTGGQEVVNSARANCCFSCKRLGLEVSACEARQRSLVHARAHVDQGLQRTGVTTWRERRLCYLSSTSDATSSKTSAFARNRSSVSRPSVNQP